MTGEGLFLSHHGHPLAAQDIAGIEQVLGNALRGLASELRLIEPADFAAFITIGHMPNLKSLVQSSVELHFKPRTLDLAEIGEAELSWFTPPLITLPMRFRSGGVRVYFRLRLAGLTAAVEIESIVTDGSAAGGNLIESLRAALEEARIARAKPDASA